MKQAKIVIRTLFVFLIVILISGCAGTGEIPAKAPIKYDVRGTWRVSFGYNWAGKRYVDCQFVGELGEGSAVPFDGEPGRYVVGGPQGDQIRFFFHSDTYGDYWSSTKGDIENTRFMSFEGRIESNELAVNNQLNSVVLNMKRIK